MFIFFAEIVEDNNDASVNIFHEYYPKLKFMRLILMIKEFRRKS